MVLNSLYWMDETTTLSQSTKLPLPKFHHNEATQQQISSQLSSIFKKQIPIESSSADNNRCSGSSTPKSQKSISSSNPLNEFLKPHSILSQNNSSESDDDDEHSKKDEINLYPLSNQVGGHTRLLLLNDKTVIKPLNVRELEFYQNIPGNDIQGFVPNYKGERTDDEIRWRELDSSEWMNQKENAQRRISP